MNDLVDVATDGRELAVRLVQRPRGSELRKLSASARDAVDTFPPAPDGTEPKSMILSVGRVGIEPTTKGL